MKIWLLLALACLPWLGLAAPVNVLLIVTDDQRPDTIHALGNGIIRTPNLDRLAERGVSFSRAYAGYPICYAARAEILTGCPSFRALANYSKGSALNPALKTIAATFRDGGYLAWYSGKWHNDRHPRDHGYTGTRGLYSSGGAQQPPKDTTDDRGNPVTGYRGWTFKTDDGKAELEKGVGLQPDNSLHVADGALAALRDTPADKPFFLHVNFAFPHDPRQWPPDQRGSYDGDKIPLPMNFAPRHPFDHGNLEGRDEELLPTPRSPDAVRREKAIYFAMISDVDHHIGSIVSALEAAGRLGNTLVIFTSDQGLALGSHGLLGKQNQYEHSIRSPLIIAGPGVRTGAQSSALVYLRDLFPTCCEAGGLGIPSTVEGLSLMPLLRGQKESVRSFVIGTFTDTQRMICDHRWKYIWYPQANREQLFDLEADPSETNDLLPTGEHHARRSEMRGRLLEWLKQNGDSLPQ